MQDEEHCRRGQSVMSSPQGSVSRRVEGSSAVGRHLIIDAADVVATDRHALKGLVLRADAVGVAGLPARGLRVGDVPAALVDGGRHEAGVFFAAADAAAGGACLLFRHVHRHHRHCSLSFVRRPERDVRSQRVDRSMQACPGCVNGFVWGQTVRDYTGTWDDPALTCTAASRRGAGGLGP